MTSCQTIEFTGIQTAKTCLTQLGHISFKDKISGERYIFLTNNFKLSAKAIADINKARWKAELFITLIKQELIN